MKVCIGIVCIGEQYLRDFEETFKPSVVKYASKYGYDLKIFSDFLDPEHTHHSCISFQKCLVPQALSTYDVVVVMDADIWLTDLAPPLPTCEKIGIVNEVAQPTKEQYDSVGWSSQPPEYYALAGLVLETDKILNTGFMICSPSRHAKMLSDTYSKYIDESVGHLRKFHYEQACIGYELQMQNEYQLIPNNWNSVHVTYKLLNIPIPHTIYGLHFAGYDNQLRKRDLSMYLSAQLPKRGIRWGIRK